MFILKAVGIIAGGNRGTELWDEYCTVVTDANITHDPTLTIVNKALRHICTSWESIHHADPLFCSANVDLVLDIVLDGAGNHVCEYYLTYHPTRVIFWPEQINPSQSLLCNMKGIQSEAHIGTVIDPL
ncbi:hypothetical protein ARMGADRAFT_1090752 [Armillaria gallica]|uniref:Uncharacterized protein n=1 Tax=Armillaria gallica TaxID=47427 RepID=A0A2H3CL38_ARMGA|nr:hypothetical protein ARMGADRAFT_1090752 [Armillaria gallica]